MFNKYSEIKLNHFIIFYFDHLYNFKDNDASKYHMCVQFFLGWGRNREGRILILNMGYPSLIQKQKKTTAKLLFSNTDQYI